jgi:hypothetical protein
VVFNHGLLCRPIVLHSPFPYWNRGVASTG